MSTIVMYHNDLDGSCAAAIVRKAYTSYLNPVGGDIVCIPVDYRGDFPIDKIKSGDDVVIVDFTPNTPEEFKQIVEKAAVVTWIDHHTKNIKKHPDMEYLRGLRVDTNPSGAGVAWIVYFPNENTPRAVEYISDFDTWTHKYPESKIFEAGMTSFDYSPENEIWNVLLSSESDGIGAFSVGNEDISAVDHPDSKVSEILDRGRVVMGYRGEWNKEYLEDYGFEATLDGYSVIACNVVHVTSDFFNSANLDKYDLMVSFVFDGRQYVYSLYSLKKGVDCASIAQKHGGGGHYSAAGFQSNEFVLKVK